MFGLRSVSPFFDDDDHDDDMTVSKHTSNSPSCKNPIDMGKSTVNDGDDDGLQRFSNGVRYSALESRDGAIGGSMGSTSATKSDAGVKLRVPTSSRTSLPARIVGRMATALQPYPTLRPARPNSGTTRARLPCPPRALPRPVALPIAPPPRGQAFRRPPRGRSRRR